MTRLDVKDFGPIARASIELKPLTVFVGPNNSGKSYLALAIYSLSNTLVPEPTNWGFRGPSRAWTNWFDFPMELVGNTGSELKRAWPNARSVPRGSIRVEDLPVGIQGVLEETMRTFADVLSSNFGVELQRCYGTGIPDLVRRGTLPSKSGLQISISHRDMGFSWEMQSTDQQLVTSKWDSRFAEQTIDLSRNAPPWRFIVENPEYFLQMARRDLAFPMLWGLITKAHYMPASRSGILLGHKTLASLIVGRASLAWVEPMDIPRLPGVITDLIQALLLLRRAGPPERKLQRVVSFLEGEVTRGTVDMDPSLGYPEIFYENDTGRFQLHQVSSMVSEVAPFVLYLKYLVRSGHLFIIEEPESHLDALNQRNLARAIAMLVNAGVKVLITTHSDYFINQINNLLLLSQLTPRRRAARKYAANEVLSADAVGAYLFCPGGQGTSVEALNITTDYGIPTSMFTDVHSTLYNEAIALEHSRQ